MRHPVVGRAWEIYLRTQQAASALLLLFTVVVTLINVIMRYLLSASIVWADEVARTAFIWMTFLAAALAVASHAHLAIDTVVERAPERVRRLLVAMANVGAVGFFALLLVGGLDQATRNMGQLSPALQFPLGYVYAAVPVSAVLMTVNLVGAHLFASDTVEHDVAGPEELTPL